MIWWQWHLTTDPIIVHTTNPISNIVHLSRILHQRRNNSLIMFFYIPRVSSHEESFLLILCAKRYILSLLPGMTSSNRYIICVPIIYISSCSAITRHTMDIIILIIQQCLHLLCNLQWMQNRTDYSIHCSYKQHSRADIMADISLTNYSRADISEISHSTTYDVWISTIH